jgi:hypothetical protein
MSVTSAGAGLEEALAAYGRAFNRFGLGRGSDHHQILQEAQTAVALLQAAYPGRSDFDQPGSAFVLARMVDTERLITVLRATPDAARGDIATSLLAVDFLLRAVHAQHDGLANPEFCINCHSRHLVPRDGGTPEAPLYQCTDCGLIAAYPRPERLDSRAICGSPLAPDRG